MGLKRDTSSWGSFWTKWYWAAQIKSSTGTPMESVKLCSSSPIWRFILRLSVLSGLSSAKISTATSRISLETSLFTRFNVTTRGFNHRTNRRFKPQYSSISNSISQISSSLAILPTPRSTTILTIIHSSAFNHKGIRFLTNNNSCILSKTI